jgi:hypothetical protein
MPATIEVPVIANEFVESLLLLDSYSGSSIKDLDGWMWADTVVEMCGSLLSWNYIAFNAAVPAMGNSRLVPA